MTFLYGSGSGFSGQRIASELIIQGLRRRGWQVQVITTPVLDRISVSNWGRWLLVRLLLGWRLLGAWIKGLWLAFSPDVLYVNLGQTKFALIRDGLPLLIKSLFGHWGRVIVSLHGNVFMGWADHSFEARLFHFMTRPASYITILGPRQKKRLVALGIPEQKVIQVDGTCLLTPITDQECLAKQSNSNRPINVLHLSNLIETKGYPEFIEAIRLLASTISQPIEVVLCGNITLMDHKERFASHEEARKWLVDQISQVNQSSGVRLIWINGAAGEAKEKLFRAAHIFVLPSRYSVEAQPAVVIEALASGCAVITTKVGEIPATVDHQTALLLDKGTPESIAEAILALQRNPDKRQCLALNGLKLYRERFAYDKHIDLWERLLLEVSGGKDYREQ